MSCFLNTLKGVLERFLHRVPIIGLIKGHTRSLDYGSCVSGTLHLQP